MNIPRRMDRKPGPRWEVTTLRGRPGRGLGEGEGPLSRKGGDAYGELALRKD